MLVAGPLLAFAAAIAASLSCWRGWRARLGCQRGVPVLAAGTGAQSEAAHISCFGLLWVLVLLPAGFLLAVGTAQALKQAVAQSAWQLGLQHFPHIVGGLRGHN
eukprot:7381223-Prymnesium_polylepis.1